MAGYYYPAEPDALRDAVDAWSRREAPPLPARAVIVPHSSFARSGAIAGAMCARVAIPRRCLLIGPSHTGSRMRWSLMAAGAYQTPLGEVPVDEASAEALRLRCPFLEVDGSAQRGEHALEVVLPFFQRLGPADLTALPIVMGAEDGGEISRLADAIAQTVRMSEEPWLLIASADLSQHEPRDRAVRLDRAVIERIAALDGAGLLRLARERPARMCGAGAAACVLQAAAALGASRGTLVRYGTSADAEGDPHAVTGYAGFLIE
ncbi:MAG: AmmeMemoRadiSam system protein B [Candidatus Omnitrophica bacterium]|nr:AmmeMemoRadiSam system protein B [Candidatus Omnitrophota bacterium]